MMSDLVDMSEIARRSGVVPGSVRNWRYRHRDFPRPVAELRIGPVWSWRAVARWLRDRGYALEDV